MEKRLWKFCIVLAVVATVISVGQSFFYLFGRGKEVYLPQIFLFSSDWILWLIFAPVCYRIFEYQKVSNFSTRLLVWILAGVIICFGHLLLKSVLFHFAWLGFGNQSYFPNVFFKMTETIHITYLTYVIIHLIIYFSDTAKSKNAEVNYQHSSATFAVKSKEGILLLQVSEIYWLQANENYVWVHSNQGKYLVDNSITNLEKELDPGLFMRIHRSAIINISKIKHLGVQINDSFVTLTNGSKVKYSKTYKKNLLIKIGYMQSGI